MLGELVECPFCQHQFIIERPAAAETPTAGKRDGAIVQAELSSLEGQLRENVTQITELRGNVSRLNMELHRHQLRMKDLADRQAELNAGIAAAKAELGA
jgi:chromosome segregation ATPase